MDHLQRIPDDASMGFRRLARTRQFRQISINHLSFVAIFIGLTSKFHLELNMKVIEHSTSFRSICRSSSMDIG
ncbi:unnamed protein product [Rhodiola kirilowii]